MWMSFHHIFLSFGPLQLFTGQRPDISSRLYLGANSSYMAADRHFIQIKLNFFKKQRSFMFWIFRDALLRVCGKV